MKRGPKASNRSSWEKRSLELEAEVGDDSDAYNVDEDELEELLIDDDTTGDDPDDEIFDDFEDDDEDEDPPLVWDEEMEDYV
jgi:hypothetical protein